MLFRSGQKLPEPGLPESFRVLKKELQALALDIRLLDDEGNEINVGNIEDEDRRFPRSFDAPKKPKEDEENDEKEDEEVDTREEFVAEGEDDIVEDSFDDDEAPESVDDIIEGLFGKSGEEEE